MKLLQSPAPEIRKVLVSIWASILEFDPSCRQELIKDKSHGYFMQYLTAKETSSNQRCKAVYVLAEICNGFKEGQQTCLQQGLHRSCSSLLAQKEIPLSNDLKKWIALCIFKLCEHNIWAKYLLLTESGYTQLFPLLINEDPCVRAAAALALGEVFGASDLTVVSFCFCFCFCFFFLFLSICIAF
jgi:regulator-associated protein of mTOR